MHNETGILLLNFGGAWTLSDVKRLLYRLSDPAVLVGVPAPFRQMLAFMIAMVQGPSSIKSYGSIRSGSPQLKWTTIQAEGLRSLLPELIRGKWGCAVLSLQSRKRCCGCRTGDADRLVLLPLFPQFSTTTTGTCFTEVRTALQRLGWQPTIDEIADWADHPEYAKLLRRMVDAAVRRAEAERNGDPEPIHIVFSAHSLRWRSSSWAIGTRRTSSERFRPSLIN